MASEGAIGSAEIRRGRRKARKQLRHVRRIDGCPYAQRCATQQHRLPIIMKKTFMLRFIITRKLALCSLDVGGVRGILRSTLQNT